VNIVQLDPALYDKFKAVSIADDQSQFVYPVERVLRELDLETSVPYGIEDEGVPVGFFILDWSDAPRSVTLKSLQIDQHAQRRSYAKAAVEGIKDLVKGRANAFHLTVNVRNTVAHRVYQSAGFITLDELYLGGPSGPQYVMVYAL
jgi:RimJ/RimL family protein N-acetyltransferase